MLGLTRPFLIDCVKEEKKKAWNEKIIPEWFADNSISQSKEPGLLKTEKELSNGQYIGLSSKVGINAIYFETYIANKSAT